MSEVSMMLSADSQADSSTRTGGAASLTSIDDVRCALCGTSLVGKRKRYRVVSPFTSMDRHGLLDLPPGGPERGIPSGRPKPAYAGWLCFAALHRNRARDTLAETHLL